MKRRHVVLVGIMCLSLLAACGKQGEENKGSMETQDTEEVQETQDMEETQDTEDTQDTGTDLIQKLEAANSEEALMQKNEKVAFTAAYSFADGTVARLFQKGMRYRSTCLRGTPGTMTFVTIGIKIIPMIAAIRMVNKMPLPQRGMWKET